ncbi:hypothetical protein, partial [Enterococcus innesii]|uniref:hypothetical protein n=1 Tax=Enterococcus innesii TaxID=2839759 RepID=UPI0034A21440
SDKSTWGRFSWGKPDTFPIFVAKKPQTNGSPLLCEKQAFKIDFFFIFLFYLYKSPLKSRQEHTSRQKGVFFL